MPLSQYHIKYILLSVIAVASLLGLVFVKQMHMAPLAWGWFGPIDSKDGIALQGYDSVAYHTQSKALPGSEEHRLNWQAVEWRFATEYNKDLFASNPERYAPQFGGYCADAVSMGMTKKADAQVWFVKDDKLYVFYGEDAKKDFIEKIPSGVLQRSHESWARRTIQ